MCRLFSSYSKESLVVNDVFPVMPDKVPQPYVDNSDADDETDTSSDEDGLP